MPTYQDIYNRHQTAIAKGHIPADLSFEDYARQGAAATGDPSWLDVAEGGPVKNWIRTKNAQLNNVIESGPVDDWTSAAVGRVGDLFGINPETSRDVGRRLPRMAVDFIPMAAGAAIGGAIGAGAGGAGAVPGAAVGARIGMGLTSGLSALNAYGESGKVLDAGIGAVSPYVGSKLSQMGTQAILANAAKPGSWLGRAGFTGGTKVAGGALTAEEQVALAASKEFGTLGADAISKMTVDKIVVDKARDKFLGYVGGELAANAGFTGLDLVTQGRDAVLNKDYLFANLVSNIPFMAAEIPGAVRTQEFGVKYNVPEAEKAYASEAEKRGYETALMFSGLDEPSVLRKYQEENLDLADFAKGVEEMNVAWEGRRRMYEELGPKYVEEWNQKATEWNAAVEGNPLAGEPVPLIDLPSNVVRDFVRAPARKDSAFPPQFQDLARKQLDALNAADNVFTNAKNGLKAIRSMTPKKLQEGYQRIADEFQLKELFQKPVGERTVEDYQTALGTSMTQKGAELIRDFHRVAAGEAPESEAYREYLQMQTDAGKVAYSPDQQFELTVAHAIATGKLPDFNTAAKRAKEALKSGDTPEQVARVAQEKLAPKVKPTGLEKLSFKQIEEVTQFRAELEQLGEPPVNLEADVPAATLHYIKAMAQSLEGSLTPRGLSNFLLVAKQQVNAVGKPLKDRIITINQNAKNAERGAKLGSNRVVVPGEVKEVGAGLNEGLVPPVEVKGGEANKDELEARPVENNDPIQQIAAEQDAIVDAEDVIEESETRVSKALEANRDWEGFWKELESTRFKAKAGNKLYAEFVESYVESLARTTKNPLFDWKKTAKRFMEATEADQIKLARLQKERDPSLKLAATGDPRVPTPDAPTMQVRAFADAIAGRMEWTNSVERERFVENLPALARLFNNPEVVYGELGVRTEEGLKMADGFYFRPAVRLNGRVVEAPLHLKAWEQHFGKPFSEFGPRELKAMEGSTLKEGYMTPAGFMDRHAALQAFTKRGGKMNLTPGEKRNWLDSSDLEGMKFAQAPRIVGRFQGMKALVSENIKAGELPFRVTYFDPDGEPFRHTSHASQNEAVDSMQGMRYRVTLKTGEEVKNRHGEFVEFIDHGAAQAWINSSQDLEKYTIVRTVNPTEAWKLDEEGMKFARIPAGGGFDFGLREVVGGKIQRAGKPAVGNRDGLMTELELRTHGKEGGTLTQDEVNFYKTLVPEAFGIGAEKKVDVQKLWDGLGKVGEQVKVVSYGQDGGDTPAKLEYDQMTHDFYDPLNYEQSNEIRAGRIPAGVDRALASRYIELRAQVMEEIKNPRASGPRATGYYNQISPFDTKKFPPVRIDVVLPNYNTSVDNLHTNVKGTVVWAMVQVVPHPRTGKKVAFIAELQSQAAQARRDQMKSLQSSIEQIEGRVKNGNLDRTAADKLIQSQRDAADAIAPDHPVLPVHQSLGLKAVIKWVKEQNQKAIAEGRPEDVMDEVAVSDGETAMMTEGHDTAVNLTPVAPKGEYDLPEWRNQIELAPGEVSNGKFKITSEGILAQSESGRWLIDIDDINATRLREITTSLNAKFGVVPRPSQEGGMRLAYDTTLPSIMSKLAGGEGKVEDFGLHKNAIGGQNSPAALEAMQRSDQEAVMQGQMSPEEAAQRQQARVIGSPVFRTSAGAPKTNATARVYDITSPSDRVNTLFAKGQGTIFGAASQKLKQIFLNSPAFQRLNPTDQLSFIFAHEHAHISFTKAKTGEYGPDAQRLITEAEGWVKQASPEAKVEVENVIRDLALPKGMDLKEIEGVLRNPDSEEWLANGHAMLAVGALSSPHPKEMFAFLPKPMRNFLDWSVKTMQNLVKGVKTWAKLGFSLDKFQQVQRMEGYFDAVRRSFRQAEFDAAEAAKFLELQEPTMRQAQAEEFVLAQDRTGRPKAWTEPRAFFGTTWQKFVVGMGNLGRMYPVLQPAIDAVRKAGDSKSALTAHVMQVMYGKMDARSRVKLDVEGPLDRVAKSPPLRALFNEMHVQMQRENSNLLEMKEMPDGTIEMAFKDDAMTPEMRGRYKQFKPEAQKALLAAAANYQRSNIELQKTLVKAEEQGAYALVANVIFSLPSQKNKGGFEQAHQRATDLFQGLAAKDDMLIQKGLAGLSEDEAATALKQTQIYVESNQELAAFYESRPSYMSLRRFKEFRQRITKGESRDVIDADSQTELNALLKKYTDKGWQLDGIVLRAKDKAQKEAFSVNDAVRDILERKEKRVKEFVESANIPDDVKADLLKQFDFVGELQHQVNAQNMYKPGANRQVVGDLSRFDVLEQFMHSVPASIAAASNAALNARVNFELRHPDLQMQRTQKDQFLALFEQSKKPDGKFVQEMNRANAAWHIGLNFPGHIAEAFQPFMSHFPELKAQGLSTWQALSSLKKTMGEVTNMYGTMLKEKVWKPKDLTVTVGDKTYDGIPAAWYRANAKKLGHEQAVKEMDMLADNISRIQRAPLQELFEVTGKEQRKLNDLMEGNRLQTVAEAIAAPVHKYEQTVMGLYSNFTQHNGLMALIPAYRQGRANGMTHEQAKLEAARFDLAVNNSGGKLERPEMFGELGLAGHAVYALSSYVRGRFAQLATYYKHGWSEHFSGEAASLTPTQRANAKKAFKSMILMQLGFAGVLGLPFVGAGIALMEEMLDEDLKGKMLEGMNEALGDPILTRVASHGAASAFAESAGIPADLHSRFALSSFMGVNSYDGVSAKSFLGPMAAMVNSLWNMGGSLAKGEGVVNALAKGGPGGVKRFAEALTDQFRSENPDMNMFSSALGFRSADMVKRKEWEGIVRNQEIESSAKRKLAASEVQKAMKLGPEAARAKLMEEAVKLLPETKNPLERQEALKGIVRGLVQRVSILSQDAVAPKDYRSVPSGGVLPQAMQTAAAMGMQQPAPMELARALAGQQARGMLGFKTSQSPMRAAAERQQQWDPFNAQF